MIGLGPSGGPVREMHGAPRCRSRLASSSPRPRQTAQIRTGRTAIYIHTSAHNKLVSVQDCVIDATKGVEYALNEIGGNGADATLMATDAIPAHEYGLQLTRKHGTFVVIGQ